MKVRCRNAMSSSPASPDTHGFTHAAMALAKLVGFDLCPRLARLADRKLFVPRDVKVPASLEAIIDRNVSWQPIVRNWDPLVRIAASMSSGWCSASLTLDRFGAAAQGNPTYTAAVALGKVLRTIYLCDYLACPCVPQRDLVVAQSRRIAAYFATRTTPRSVWRKTRTTQRGTHCHLRCVDLVDQHRDGVQYKATARSDRRRSCARSTGAPGAHRAACRRTHLICAARLPSGWIATTHSCSRPQSGEESSIIGLKTQKAENPMGSIRYRQKPLQLIENKRPRYRHFLQLGNGNPV